LSLFAQDCDPTTGEPDEEGYPDEYVIEDLELTTADHVLPVSVPNFAGMYTVSPTKPESVPAVFFQALWHAIKTQMCST
jgi:hypothetical protein